MIRTHRMNVNVGYMIVGDAFNVYDMCMNRTWSEVCDILDNAVDGKINCQDGHILTIDFADDGSLIVDDIKDVDDRRYVVIHQSIVQEDNII